MSAQKHEKTVAELVRDAERSNDPARLRQIADKLQQQSAWAEAQRVRRDARELEMRLEAMK